MKKILFLLFICFLLYSCSDKKVENKATINQDSIDLAKIESEKQELYEKYKQVSNIDDPWNIWFFDTFGEDETGFYKVWVDTVQNEELRLKRKAKWNYFRALKGSKYDLRHYDAIVYKHFYNQTSLPNIDLEKLSNDMQIIENTSKYKTIIDSLDSETKFNNYLVSEGHLSEELYNKFKLKIILAFDTKHLTIVYRNERTITFLWENIVRENLYSNFSKKLYKEKNADFYIDNLILSYKILAADSNSKQIFENAIETMSEEIDYSQFYTDIFNKKFENSGKLVEPSELSDDIITRWKNWFFSFWFRRYIEGTSDITYKILLEIKEHYK